MKYHLCTKAILLLGVAGLSLTCHQTSFGQCKEKRSESTQQKIRYQTIPLNGKHEYLVLSNSGEEKLFTYHNEKIDLVYHVQMFTEIKFTSSKGNFSLYTTNSDRAPWRTCFTLSSPLIPQEIEKMKGVSKIQIILPEEKKVFSLNTKQTEMLQQAVACLY
ncbi:MAG: hypothetical protein ABIN80_11080 [Dyadobacter sp.]|uniref:hypothetical protein n=1 Tax=Dyadobacter sp. TaxID=1914288 RepID=UPI003263CE70